MYTLSPSPSVRFFLFSLTCVYFTDMCTYIHIHCSLLSQVKQSSRFSRKIIDDDDANASTDACTSLLQWIPSHAAFSPCGWTRAVLRNDNVLYTSSYVHWSSRLKFCAFCTTENGLVKTTTCKKGGSDQRTSNRSRSLVSKAHESKIPGIASLSFSLTLNVLATKRGFLRSN